jgi:broad specificity polyphosphatase/5'/3'-nucleotidase SurE
MLSGTVGAALAGTLLLDPPVPGMAVNAPRLRDAEPVDSPANRTQYEAVGVHLARMVDATRGWFCERGAVVRARTVLNVNYPAVPVPQLRGIRVTRQGATSDLRVTFSAIADGEYRAQTQRVDATDQRDTDISWLQQGYVTVTPVSGAILDSTVPTAPLQRRLRGF